MPLIINQPTWLSQTLGLSTWSILMNSLLFIRQLITLALCQTGLSYTFPITNWSGPYQLFDLPFMLRYFGLVPDKNIFLKPFSLCLSTLLLLLLQSISMFSFLSFFLFKLVSTINLFIFPFCFHMPKPLHPILFLQDYLSLSPPNTPISAVLFFLSLLSSHFFAVWYKSPLF